MTFRALAPIASCLSAKRIPPAPTCAPACAAARDAALAGQLQGRPRSAPCLADLAGLVWYSAKTRAGPSVLD
jgi:hypothetical protein